MDTIKNCDPCSFDVQDLTITRLLHRTVKPTVNLVRKKHLEFHDFNPAGTYDVLPFYNAAQIRRELKNYLTFPQNQFLTLRFQRFNKVPPTKTLQLEVMTYKKRPKSPIRRKILNGEPMSYDGKERYPVPTDTTTRKSLKRVNDDSSQTRSTNMVQSYGGSRMPNKTSKKSNVDE